MSERHRINDDDIDRALASLVDGEMSRGSRASVMRQLAGDAVPRRGRPSWRPVLAAAGGVAVLVLALGIWSLRVGEPTLPEPAAPPQVAALGTPARPGPVEAAPPVVARRTGAPSRPAATGRARPPVAGVLAHSAVAAEETGTADTTVVVQLSVAPLDVPDPLEVAPLARTLAAADHPAVATSPSPEPAPAASPAATLASAVPPPGTARPLSEPLQVAPLTFDSLKLEKVDVPPLTLPPPVDPDIKRKPR